MSRYHRSRTRARMYRLLPLAAGQYHALSSQAKQRVALKAARVPPLRCARCLTWVTPEDMANHLADRCMGSPERRDAVLVLVERRRDWLARRRMP
jgi:hypothetical protein